MAKFYTLEAPLKRNFMDLNSIERGLTAIDDRYAVMWCNDTAFWARQGIYQQVAELIELNPGQLHVDIGAGNLAQLVALRKRNPQAVLVGLESNIPLLTRTETVFRDHGIPLTVHGSRSLDFVDQEQTRVRPVFHTDLQAIRDSDFLKAGSPIRVLVDDIRRMSLLQQILGDKKLRSVSYMFPGRSVRYAYEHPYSINDMGHIDETEESRRALLVGQAVNKDVYRVLTDLVEPGGKLLVVDRVMAEVHDDLKTVPGKETLIPTESIDYWDNPERGYSIKDIIQGDGRGTRMQALSDDGDAVLETTSNRVHVVVVQFTRNGKVA
jgi:hypothetical protein